MATSKKSRHKHNFVWQITGTAPGSKEDLERHWKFQVIGTCSCGRISSIRDATYSEVEDYLKNISCSFCGLIGENHKSQQDCNKYLVNRIEDLESRLQIVEDKLHKISSIFRDSSRNWDYY